jgi:hypothetical protein
MTSSSSMPMEARMMLMWCLSDWSSTLSQLRLADYLTP